MNDLLRKHITELRRPVPKLEASLRVPFPISTFLCFRCGHGTIYIGPAKLNVHFCQNCHQPLDLMDEFGEKDLHPEEKEK